MLLHQSLLFTTLLFTLSLSAEIDPTLTEWKLIERGVEIVNFPLNKYILQIKSFRSNIAHGGDPLYANNTVVDKSTSMLVHYMVGGRRIGQFVWNTIPYVAGTDVILFGCQAPYSRYRSNPCDGQHEQIWSWDFTVHGATLTCFDEVQYEVSFERSRNPACNTLGSLPIDQLRFTNMAGFYYRARPADPTLGPDALQKSTRTSNTYATTLTTLPPTTPPPGPPINPTCNCWTRECNFCRDLTCAVKYDVTAMQTGITVNSVLNRKDLNQINLYNAEGKQIGYFKWNLKSIFLEGCIFCRTPRSKSILKGEENEWNFSFVGGQVVVSVGGEELYRQKLRRGCRSHYEDVQYFSFQRMSCDSYFKVEDEMERGEKVNPTCNGHCEG